MSTQNSPASFHDFSVASFFNIFLLSIAISKVLPALPFFFCCFFLSLTYVNPLSVLLNENFSRNFFFVLLKGKEIQRSLEGETIFSYYYNSGWALFNIHAYFFNKQEDIWWKEFYRNS